MAAVSLIALSTIFHLANPLNAMQILFINILMDGEYTSSTSSFRWQRLMSAPVAGPPSQSLGVDPADRSVMKRPPRKKDAPIINKRLIARVLFSASMIIVGVLFIYLYELSDGSMSRRDQTMASSTSRLTFAMILTSFPLQQPRLSRRSSFWTWYLRFKTGDSTVASHKTGC